MPLQTNFSQLLANFPASPLTGTEAFAFDQAGTTKGATAKALRDFFLSSGQFVDSRDFSGIDSTGNNDSSVGMNLALNQAIAANLPLKFPPGFFSMASVPIGYGAPQGASFAILGAGGIGAQTNSQYNLPTPPYALAINTCNTIFVNQTKVLPTFALNSVDGVLLKDFGIMGQNYAPSGTVGYGCPLDDYTRYLTAGVRGGPGIPNSPYCAIALDPFIFATPPDGGYPGLAAAYTNTFGSNAIFLENITANYFFVTLALSTSGAVAENGSYVDLRNVVGSWCDTFAAIGQSQSRLFTMGGGGFGGCRQGFDGLNYGNRQGCPPALVKKINIGYAYRIFSLPNAFGSLTLEQCYAESFRQIGLFGNGPSGNAGSGLSIQGGDLFITQQPGWPPPPPIVLESYGTTKLAAGGLGYASSAANIPALNLIGGASPIDLDSMALGAYGPNPIMVPFIGYNKNMTSQVSLRNCVANGRLLTDIYPRTYGLASAAINQRLITTWGSRFIPNGNSGEYAFTPGTGLPEVQINASSITLNLNPWPTASSLTFNSIDSLKVQVGDVLYWQALPNSYSLEQYIVPMLKVASVVGSLVTCSLLFDPLCYDSVANWNVYQAGAMFVVPQQWAPITTVTATTNGTTSVALTGGSGQYNIIQNGDWVLDSANLLPSGARVVSGSGSATLVLSAAAVGSGPTALYFGRLYPMLLGAPI